MSSKGGAGWEGWGYCGNCQKEGRSPQCERGAHTVLDQPWRAVKGEDIVNCTLTDRSASHVVLSLTLSVLAR